MIVDQLGVCWWRTGRGDQTDCLGEIVVDVQTLPPGGTGFVFHTGGGLFVDGVGGGETTFELDDGQTISMVVIPGSGYTVTQAPNVGWELIEPVACDDTSGPSVNIDVEITQTVNCAFVSIEPGGD